MKLQHFETAEYSWPIGDYVISTERHRIDPARLVEHYRAEAYWAKALEYRRFHTAIANSLPFGVYDAQGNVAGFCRVVTDGAMFAYMRDVLILEAHRGRGLGTALCRQAIAHPDLGHVDNWLLRTSDAHGVYAKLGFTPISEPETYMHRKTPRTPWEDE